MDEFLWSVIVEQGCTVQRFLFNSLLVIAGDLKSKNVLLTKNGANAKLSDVGMSRVLGTTLNTSVSSGHTAQQSQHSCACDCSWCQFSQQVLIQVSKASHGTNLAPTMKVLPCHSVDCIA